LKFNTLIKPLTLACDKFAIWCRDLWNEDAGQ
jgi:hypothetical protein